MSRRKSFANNRQLLVGTTLVAAATVFAAYLHGHVSQRWNPASDTITAARSLEEFPHEFGDWRMQTEAELGDATVEMLRCVGSTTRTYKNIETGETVYVAMMFGPPSTLTVHTPQICFSSQSFQKADSPEQVRIASSSGEEGQFWTQAFKSTDADGGLLRVYYGWCAEGKWQAPERARYRLAKHPYVYKVQVSAPVWKQSDTNNAAIHFISDFIDVSHATLE